MAGTTEEEVGMAEGILQDVNYVGSMVIVCWNVEKGSIAPFMVINILQQLKIPRLLLKPTTSTSDLPLHHRITPDIQTVELHIMSQMMGRA